MEKELQDLLDNYERSIYGKEVAKMPTIHQIHLLLDYIANQSVQLEKLKEKMKDKYMKNGVFSLEYDKETLRDMVLELQEIIQKAIEYIRTEKNECEKNHVIPAIYDFNKLLKILENEEEEQ